MTVQELGIRNWELGRRIRGALIHLNIFWFYRPIPNSQFLLHPMVIS